MVSTGQAAQELAQWERRRHKRHTAWRDVQERHRSSRMTRTHVGAARRATHSKSGAFSTVTRSNSDAFNAATRAARRPSEEEHEDVSMAPPPLRQYGLRWFMEKEGHNIEKEEADYRPSYDPRGVDVTKTKEPEGINGPVLTVNKHNARIDNMLSHLVGPVYEEPLDDDVAMEDKMEKVD
ncbi:hypothetical protein HAX54_035682 [Datura stramonium]|uniref:Uncharacterized protein n=1 Tax=Datura stramonium TaxID=4076 RepID=A0ABS8SFS9_DATST|nr:hypothetical protein [Datura stramonium]